MTSSTRAWVFGLLACGLVVWTAFVAYGAISSESSIRPLSAGEMRLAIGAYWQIEGFDCYSYGYSGCTPNEPDCSLNGCTQCPNSIIYGYLCAGGGATCNPAPSVSCGNQTTYPCEFPEDCCDEPCMPTCDLTSPTVGTGGCGDVPQCTS